MIIRAIGVLEGIALVGDPDFAIIDEARAERRIPKNHHLGSSLK